MMILDIYVRYNLYGQHVKIECSESVSNLRDQLTRKSYIQKESNHRRGLRDLGH